MAMITCKECGAEVSSEAKTCPKCGVRVKARSTAWLWALNVPLAVAVYFVVFHHETPEDRQQTGAQIMYERCMKDFEDPLIDPVRKAESIRPACEMLRNDYIAKYGRAP